MIRLNAKTWKVFEAMFAVLLLVRSGNAQLVSRSAELDKPLNAFAKSTSWMEVLEGGYDLEATAHYGGADGPPREAHWETICKCRQIRDEKNGIAFTPWATGAIEVEENQGKPNDFRERKVRVVEGNSLREIDFLTKEERDNLRCDEDCLVRASPINLMQAVCNHALFDVTIVKPNEFNDFMERLSTLSSGQLVTTNEQLNGKDVLVFRIKVNPSPKSVAIPALRIVVSNSGIDKGLITEIHNGFIKLENKDKYTGESQLSQELGMIHHTVRWEEVSLPGKTGKIRKLILPVSVSKNVTYPNIKGKRYFNLELIWRGFTKESQKICSIDGCDKLTVGYLKEIDDVLGR